MSKTQTTTSPPREGEPAGTSNAEALWRVEDATLFVFLVLRRTCAVDRTLKSTYRLTLYSLARHVIGIVSDTCLVHV